jgi:hypothetical protein
MLTDTAVLDCTGEITAFSKIGAHRVEVPPVMVSAPVTTVDHEHYRMRPGTIGNPEVRDLGWIGAVGNDAIRGWRNCVEKVV